MVTILTWKHKKINRKEELYEAAMAMVSGEISVYIHLAAWYTFLHSQYVGVDHINLVHGYMESWGKGKHIQYINAIST